MMLITVSEYRLMLAPGNDVIFPHQTWEDYERLLNLRQDKTFPKLYFNAKTQEIRLMSPLPSHGNRIYTLSSLVTILLSQQGKDWQAFDPITLKIPFQAGLIPALDNQLGANNLVILSFVPDVNPFESFYGCLLANRYPQAAAKLARIVEDGTLIKVVNGLKKEAQWLIFIDQFEELFTRTPKKEQSIFIKSLIQLIEKSDNSVKVVMTMRADFLDKLSPYPDLGKIHDRFSLMLTDMDDGELRLAIAEPAARNGVIFEKGLIDTIIADFKQQAGSLPLLQYTLDLLWKKDDLQDRVLKTKTYQALGGVTGALQKQANTIYDKFDERQRNLAKQIFLELISLEGKEAVSRRADKAIFEQDEVQKEVLYQLIDNRLLVSRGEDGKATVEVAHEELIRSWEVLQELIRENEQIIILRNRLYADAKQWDELRKQDAVKARGELWSGSKLARIVELKKEQSLPNLDAVASDFIEASVTQAERQKNQKIRNARRFIAGSLVSTVISSGLGWRACNSGLGWMAWKQAKQTELSQEDGLMFALNYPVIDIPFKE